MKLDVEKTKKIIDGLINGIANRAIYTKLVPRFLQLYLDAEVERGLDKVDTCATSQCLSVLAKAQYNDEDLISEAVASVVRLRNQEGSWPSAITPEELADPNSRRPGDTAIGDNCFALTALIDADFLDESFKYSKCLSEEYKKLSFRISYVLTAVDWLLKNKANDQIGWYYTDNVVAKSQSVTLTTLNVLQIFSEIICCLEKCVDSTELSTEQKDCCNIYIEKLKSELQTTTQQLNDVYENIQNQWLAIGKHIGSHDPSIIHTCKLLNLILFNKRYNKIDLYDEAPIQDLIKFVVDNISSDEGLKKYAEPFYFESYELSKKSGLGLLARTICVDHENFAEGIILFTAINIFTYWGNIDAKLITNMANILTTQERMSLAKPYFFLCRSKREEKNNWNCPVYASYEAYKALRNYMDNYDLIYSSSCSDTKSIEIVKKEDISDAIEKLEKAIHMNIHKNGFPSDVAHQYLKQLKTMQKSYKSILKKDFYALLAEIKETTGVSF